MVNWREAGSGPALTLLHGISSGADSWHKQLEAPLNARVLAWDMPGYGSSAGLKTPQPDALSYARRLLEMLDSAGVQQTVLVGHSLGALVASAFAATFPDRVSRLVLADPAQGYGAADAGTRERVWRQRQQQMAAGGEQMAAGRAANLLRPDARAGDIATVAAGMKRLHSGGYLAAAWMLAHDDINRWLTAWGRPFEVWCGAQDAITPPDKSQALATRWQMPYLSLPDAGHASYLDNDIFFNQQLSRVITEASDERTN
ncbi:alpha/beta hydrolase [Salmonella enterica subsp. enterica serovar Choleraesuis]|nr:alpha/beta hydrolase [Salmonella enterica subsp. enterica serovar Choleraesuis]